MIILVALVLMLIAIAAIVYGLRQLDHFLSLSRPIASEVMVMEGWLPDTVKQQVLRQYRQGGYRKMVITGGPITHGLFLSAYKSHAEMGSATMIALGMHPDQVIAVPAPEVDCYRTTAAAMSLKKYIDAEGILSFNLYSLGSHARRSYYIFRQVFGPGYRIGVVAMPPLHYDPDRWWTTSHGFRTVIPEAIAYFYVRLVGWHD